MKSGWLVFWTCVVLLVAGLAIQRIPLPAGCSVLLARDVGANHRIVPEDVKVDAPVRRCLSWFAPTPDEVVGNYVISMHRAGSSLTREQTAPRPTLPQSPKTFIESFPLDQDAMLDGDPNVDAGEAADVCGIDREQRAECVHNLRVAAVVCPSVKCFAMLVVPSDRGDQLFAVEHLQAAKIFEVSAR